MDAMAQNVPPVPEGLHTVTPHITVDGAANYIDLLKRAFGAVELSRSTIPTGKIIHATVRIGDSVLMLGEATDRSSAIAGSFYIYVDDADAVYRAALSAGGESLEKPADRFWGDRVGTIKDFAGNKWLIATHVEDVSSDEIAKRAQQAMAA